MNEKEIINLLLQNEIEINNKIHHAISEILRLGSNTERGKKITPNLIESIKYSLDDMEQKLNK